MGEAKIKLEAIRKKHLGLADYWDFPPTPEEAAVCASLRELDIVTAHRASRKELSYMRMPENGCHENSRWYERNDPTKRSIAITGWWVQWPDFVLHSVVKIDEHYVCVTPNYIDEPDFPFMPDPNVSWEAREGTLVPLKFGYNIGIGVRLFPAFTLARLEVVRSRLRSGMHPAQAMQFSDAEMADLKSRYIDADIARTWNPHYR